jgi:hypothetical protein
MYSEKTCPGATLSTTNPTWPDPGLNPGRRGAKPATNRFSYGAAIFKEVTKLLNTDRKSIIIVNVNDNFDHRLAKRHEVFIMKSSWLLPGFET